MEQKRLFMNNYNLKIIFLLLMFFVCKIGFTQTYTGNCCLGHLDTVLMIGDVGGYSFLVDNDYLLKHEQLKVNIDGLKIVSYEFTYWGFDNWVLFETDRLPLMIKKSKKKYSVILFKNVIVKTNENTFIKLKNNYSVLIKHKKK